MESTPSIKTKNWYDKYYKLMLIIPAIMLIFSAVYLFQFYQKNGDIIYKDVSITGGTTITVFAEGDVSVIQEALRAEFPDITARSISDIRTGKQQGFFLETKAEPEQLKLALEKYLGFALTEENSSIEFSGAAIAEGFYQQLRFAVFLSFLFMAIVVFVIFRSTIPSGAVIFAAFADIVMTIVAINLLGIQVATAGIVALLMLIGYSVDTDILLTTRVLRKKEGSINHRIYGAFKTGMTMTVAAIVSVLAALVVIYNFSETLRHMFEIILIGLLFDVLNTWVTNASMLKWYAEVKKIA